MSLIQQVKTNLLFQNLWTDVSEIPLKDDVLLKGIPKEPLLQNDDDNNKIEDNKYEIVLPIYLENKLTPNKLNQIFNQLQEFLDSRPKRIIIGIVNDDSTVVYYFIHDGVYKPKKN